MKKKWLDAAVLTFLILCLSGVAFGQARQDVTIGVLIDGKGQSVDRFVGALGKEARTLLGTEYSIRIPSAKILSAEWSVERARKNYRRLAVDKDVDIMVVAGIISSSVLAERRVFTKPVIAVGIVDPVIQGFRRTRGNTSGIHNFTYVMFNQSVERDMDVFYSVYPYKKVGIAVSAELLELIPNKGRTLKGLMEKNRTAYVNIPVRDGIGDVLDSLEGVDAVYLGYLGRFEGAGKNRLIEALNDRGIPSFGGSVGDVAQGVLAATAPGENFLKLLRRVSLNIEAILNGEDLAELPVNLSFDERLTINMATARKIGLSPRFDVLSRAELINDFSERNDRVLDLKMVMEEALRSSLKLAVEFGDVQLTAKDLELARSNYFPSVTVGASGTVIDDDVAAKSLGTQAERTASGVAKLEQLIFSEPQVAGVAARKHLVTASEYAYDSAGLDVAQEAAAAYFDVLKAKTLRNIRKEDVELTRKHLSIAKQREAIGYSGKSDVYRWESSLASATTDLLEAKNNFRLSKIRLSRIINQPLGEDFQVAEAALEGSLYEDYKVNRVRAYVDNPASLDRFTGFLIDEAIIHSPELKEIDAAIAARERRYLSLERKRIAPVVSLGAESQHVFDRSGAGSDVPGTDPEDNSWKVGVNLSWTLYQGGSISVDRARTAIEIRKLKNRRAQAKQSVELNVRAAVLDIVAKVVNLKSSRRSSEFAHKSLELVQDAYAKGRVSISDLADAQSTALNADLGALNSVYEFLASLLNVERAVGQFSMLSTPAESAAYLERLDTYIKTHQ